MIVKKCYYRIFRDRTKTIISISRQGLPAYSFGRDVCIYELIGYIKRVSIFSDDYFGHGTILATGVDVKVNFVI